LDEHFQVVPDLSGDLQAENPDVLGRIAYHKPINKYTSMFPIAIGIRQSKSDILKLRKYLKTMSDKQWINIHSTKTTDGCPSQHLKYF
jgi:hypothetical protein